MEIRPILARQHHNTETAPQDIDGKIGTIDTHKNLLLTS